MTQSEVFTSTDQSVVEEADHEYRVHSGDELSVTVYRERSLSGLFQVDPTGVIRHPLLGSVQVADMSLKQVESVLTDELGEKYLINPRVMVSMEFTQNSSVVMLGEIAQQGALPIPLGGSFTLLQAVANAGGFTDLASVNRVTVTRKVDGKEQSIRVRVSRMISGEEPDMPLLANDVIVVPQIKF